MPALQLTLAGFGPAPARAKRWRLWQACTDRRSEADADGLVTTYLRRLAARGAAMRGIGAYGYQLRTILRTAHRLSGREQTLQGLFGDADLLGRTLVDDASPTGRRLSKWTLAQRRSAIRSFAGLMRPELHPVLGEEPLAIVARALRAVAERVGGGYRLTGGRPRQRGGFVPSPDEVARVLAALGRTPGFVGRRDRAFFGLLAATGCRVNALRLLDGSDITVMPNGHLRLYLHEKGKSERREVKIGAGTSANLRDYLDWFNRTAASRRWRARVRIGEPSAVWRGPTGLRWGYPGVVAALRAGCVAAGVPDFAPHALRRAYATEAASRLPRHVVAQAGGWKGLQRLDDHYVRPREVGIREKLARRIDGHVRSSEIEEEAVAPAVPV